MSTELDHSTDLDHITEGLQSLAVDKVVQFTQMRSTTMIQATFRNKLKVATIKNYTKELVASIKRGKHTEPGSLTYLFNGPQPSGQSLNIQLGHIGEKMFKKMIMLCPDCELLQCGLHGIDGKKTDLDLLWLNSKSKTVYYREAKGNIEMDTEKIPAMISKINDSVKTYVETSYPTYAIDIGVLAWSVYNRNILKKGLSHIKKIEENGIQVDHVEDMLRLTNIQWKEDDFYEFMRSLPNSS